MRTLFRLFVLTVALAIAAGAAGFLYLRNTGLTARALPGALEAAVARAARSLAVPPEYKNRANPLPRTPEHVRAGLEHFADHCASCHANDGSGNIALGRSFFPPAPDMRAEETQRLTDGELLYIIEHGIRFTGMPAWGDGTEAGERLGWQLFQFNRHLPRLTQEELEQMEALNPRPPEEIRQEIEAERFLRGEDVN
jgi:mono/diheme cytochrome c family protein